MSPHDLYDVLALLQKGQDSGVRLLEFSIGDNFNSNSDAELPEPPASPRDVNIDDMTAEADGNTSAISYLPIQPPSQATVSPASPMIDPPQSTPTISDSMIKSAIENVAEAGYLNISDVTIDAASQGKSNNSKKRRQEEQSGKQTKKHRGNAVVPTREQSLRYDILHIFYLLYRRLFAHSLKDANYKNKHVTVRPR
jgi:hypothetical protein